MNCSIARLTVWAFPVGMRNIFCCLPCESLDSRKLPRFHLLVPVPGTTSPVLHFGVREEHIWSRWSNWSNSWCGALKLQPCVNAPRGNLQASYEFHRHPERTREPLGWKGTTRQAWLLNCWSLTYQPTSFLHPLFQLFILHYNPFLHDLLTTTLVDFEYLPPPTPPQPITSTAPSPL